MEGEREGMGKEREVVRGREGEGREWGGERERRERGGGRSKQRRGRGPLIRVGMLIWEFPLVWVIDVSRGDCILGGSIIHLSSLSHSHIHYTHPAHTPYALLSAVEVHWHPYQEGTASGDLHSVHPSTASFPSSNSLAACRTEPAYRSLRWPISPKLSSMKVSLQSTIYNRILVVDCRYVDRRLTFPHCGLWIVITLQAAQSFAIYFITMCNP